ncbi:WD40 repeat-like protein [Coccomyxa subellipsoidea C-169]|uniref:WD40 repeat-like protein n=1 Tax=Coccomyxa subellipsoidea (strain C-169) TaxID=574566 RepID=I0ZAS1_COCSC|nr:WD40 repeat-like protein [Coccomyxa subellipsoidea C-169]EIE27740.1 WD40 repeat-like protein [Coccomyxa subellipsoidea C-169]|eukprot:XP_005652284.1 WD40 repeat-like protein [Coccomyxa subellipsoidea C-169]
MAASQKNVTYGLKFQARAMVPFQSEGAQSRWLVGTNALRDENEIQILEFDPEKDTIRMAEVHSHPQEVWQIAPCPSDPRTLMTIHNEGIWLCHAEGVHTASLWHMPEENGALEQKAELKGTSSVRAVAWHPAQADTALSVEGAKLLQWRLGGASAEVASECASGGSEQLSGGAWDPHDPNRFCSTGGSSVQVWDLRSGQQSGAISSAHGMPVRDVDFAKQQDNLIVTAGDDCKLRLWDLRHAPAQSAMASPAGKRAAAAGGAGAKDGKVQSYGDHEDSVYSVAWSTSDPWTFASLSYDGRVAVHRVPSQVKYKILI